MHLLPGQRSYLLQKGVHGSAVSSVGGASAPCSLDLDQAPQHYQQLNEISAVRMGAPHEDAAAALSHGTDGDRTLLDVQAVPVT